VSAPPWHLRSLLDSFRTTAEIRTGFERPFWVANISEIFERLSYYAVFAALARYLHEALQFPTDQAASLSGLFGGAVWVMAIIGRTLRHRIELQAAQFGSAANSI